MTLRMTLIAGAIAALVAAPTWAATSDSKEGTQTQTGPSTSQRAMDAPTAPGTPGAARSSDSSPAGARSSETAPGRSTGTSTAPGASGAARSSDSSPAGARSSETAAGSSMGTPGSAQNQARSRLYGQSAGHLKGMDVVDLNGEDVGKVARIVLAPDRKDAHAVITYGGVLGLGSREVLMSLDKLTEVDGKLQVRESKAQVEAMQEHKRSDQFVELTGDNPVQGSIVEFSAFEPGTDAGSPASTSTTPRDAAPSGSASPAPRDAASPGSTPTAPSAPR